MRTAKLLFLYFCKYIGIFLIFRYINRHRIRILCYHGLAFTADQSRFRPKLFMDADKFKHRMLWLRKAGYHAITLEEALGHLSKGNSKSDSIVITMDDGFYSLFSIAIPILRNLDYPVTIYVTTWYVENQLPIMNIVIPYIFWCCSKDTLATSAGILTENKAIDICTNSDNTTCQKLLAELAEKAGISFDEISNRHFHLMTTAEIAELANSGVDIQLHTHHHVWPKDPVALRNEISENRRVLRPITKNALVHFCFPSGIFSEILFPVLKELGIKSATTLERGLVDDKDDMLKLPRLLDGTNISQIEFEARICGFLDWVR